MGPKPRTPNQTLDPSHKWADKGAHGAPLRYGSPIKSRSLSVGAAVDVGVGDVEEAAGVVSAFEAGVTPVAVAPGAAVAVEVEEADAVAVEEAVEEADTEVVAEAAAVGELCGTTQTVPCQFLPPISSPVAFSRRKYERYGA